MLLFLRGLAASQSNLQPTPMPTTDMVIMATDAINDNAVTTTDSDANRGHMPKGFYVGSGGVP